MARPTVPRPRLALRALAAGLAAVLTLHAAPSAAQVDAFRITDLDLRDPHVFVNFLGCRDLTDNTLLGFSLNSQLQTQIQTDAGGDGALDMNMMLIWEPLDATAWSGFMLFGFGNCTAPMAGTVCQSPPDWNPIALRWTHHPSGVCLSPLAGTLRPYTPAVTNSASPCFTTSATDLTLNLASGIPITLRSARVGATFVGTPPGQLLNGVLRGFLTEADANAIILPASFPLVGGKPLSAILPGGDPPGSDVCCATHSDKDVSPGGEIGWWMYFNFTASRVPWTGPALDVADRGPGGVRLEIRPNPARVTATVEFETGTSGRVEVTVFDLNGRRVSELFAGESGPGPRQWTWDGRTPGGGQAPAGLYFVRVLGPGVSAVRRFALAR